MSRLTKEIKEMLTTNLLRVSPLYEKAKATLAARADLVERIRQACLAQSKTTDEEIASIVEKVKAIKGIDTFVLPVVRVNRTKADSNPELCVGLNGQARDLSLRGVDKLWNRDYGTHRLTDAHLFGPGVRPDLVPDRFVPIERILLVEADKFHDELCASDVAIVGLREELEAFRLKVMGALKDINTVKQLQKHWPDAVDYLPEIVRPAKTEIALSVDDLNAICGLPK